MYEHTTKYNFSIRVISGIIALFAMIYLGGLTIVIIGSFGGFIRYISEIRYIVGNFSYYWVFGNLFGILISLSPFIPLLLFSLICPPFEKNPVTSQIHT